MRAGWRTDQAGNLAALPNSEEARQELKKHGVERPVHRSGHPVWNEDVRVGLRDIRDKLRDSGLTEGSDAFNLEARRLLDELQSELRQKMSGLLKLGAATGPGDRFYG